MKSFAVLAIALAITAHCYAQSIDDCLQKDSISCVQKSIFRKAKELLNKDSYEIVSGISLVKSDRSARSIGNDLAVEQEIEKAESIEERQSAIESYVGDEVVNFFTGRSLRVNFAPTIEKIGNAARALSESIPTEIREVADDIVEGRNKKKHMIKKFLPLIALAKAKLGFLAVLGYFALALIAKKAIFISLISIAISAFVGLRGLFSRGMGHHDGAGFASSGAASWAPAPPASSGWSAPSSHGWDDGHVAAQSQAFSGYPQ